MKIKYEFLDGQTVQIEVSGEFANVILELEIEQKNNDRKETRRHESLDLLENDICCADKSSDLFDETLKKTNSERLYEAIKKLKPCEKDLIFKLYLSKNPISQSEYARILGITPKSVQEKSRRIRRKLEEFLKK